MLRVGPISAPRLLASALVLLTLAIIAHAQITNVTNDTITPIEGAGHDYIKMLSETVNPANGGLNLHIDLPVAKSRGLTVPFSITYDSNNVHHLTEGIYNSWGSVNWYANSSLLGQGGWSFALPYARLDAWYENVAVLTGLGSGGQPIYTVYACGNASNYVMLDLSGITHSLVVGARSGLASGDPNNYCGAGSASPGSDTKVNSFFGSWGGAISQPPALTVNDDLGTVYKYSAFKPDSPLDPSSYAAMPDTIEDRNGNIATFAINASKAVTVTDSSGRTSISTSGFGPSGSTNTVIVSGETFQVTWRTVSANFPTTQPPQWVGQSGGPSGYTCIPPGSASDSQTVVSQITLPNGKLYKFYYGNDVTPHSAPTNPYGVVSEIDYPSGAWATYSWKLSDTVNELADYPGVYNAGCGPCGTCGQNPPPYCSAPVPDGCRYLYQTPVVASRQVSFGTTSPSLTQTFIYSTTWGSTRPLAGWTSKSTTVTTTDNLTGKSATTIYSYKSIFVPIPPFSSGSGTIRPQVAVEQTENYSDWNSNPLRTTTKDWQNQFDMILDQTTVCPGGTCGISSQKNYTYVTNSTITEPQEVDEYDFGVSPPGPATRITVTNYQTFSGAPGIIAAAPSSVIVCSSGSPGSCSSTSSNRVSETDYAYDQAATQPKTGVVQHDDTNFPTSFNVRGNLTTKTVDCFVGSTGCTNAVTTYTYDQTGRLLSSTDACGNATCSDMTGSSHTTNYGYTDSYTQLSGGQNQPYTPSGNTNAYLTQITDPLGHTASFKYDFTNGQLTSSTDANNQTTTYIYNDFFARPTLVTRPDTGTTTVSYNDSAYNPSANTPSVTTTQSIAAGVSITNIAALDGAGHVVRTILNSDPDGADTTDTTYDGFGRVLTQSNPHRSTSSTTDGTTTYAYDALGRATSVTKQDGSAVSTTYDIAGTNTICTQVADEVGNARKSCSNGLGQMLQVFEDPGSSPHLNYETDYAYDTLSNLLTVNQKGNDPNSADWRPRSFTYDSRSRLLTATNPESGTITYTYDANGNVASKVAPLPNQTGASTVTTNYTYDNGNRLLSKSYVGMSTAGATYGYDGTAPSSCTPPTLTDSYKQLHRTGMCDASGATSWAHDQMGRTITESRKIGTVTKNTSYTYNLDSSLASLTYPTGRVVSYAYVPPSGSNSAARQISATDSTGPINYTSGAHYAAFGGLTSLTLGSQPITVTNGYNDRLQPVLLSASTTAATIMSLCYDFHLHVAVSISPCSLSASSSGDNGNAFQVINNRDSNRTQNFMYDSLNRIQQAYTSGPNWGETSSPVATAPGVAPTTSGIDAWGNLTNRSGVTGKTSFESLSAAATTKNQLTGFGYDAAGNMTSNGSATYTYDAESRITSSAGCTFTYDGDGNRVQKTGCGSIVYWRNLGGDTLEEASTSGTMLREYVFFNGQRIARRDVSTNNVFYFFDDHLGSTSLVTNSAGAMPPQMESDYYPYGGEIPITTGIQDQNYKFTGKERDSATGLDNFGARYDASSLGRFMTPDNPKYADRTDPQTWNLYSYVNNNPLSKTDPDGHNWFDINGQWSWHQGDSYTYKGADGKDVTAKSSYQYLLTFQKTGTNKEGATTGTLTLYGNDQGKAVASAQVFSGGKGNGAIPNGEYMMRLDIRGSATTMADMKANGQELKQFYGIQDISGGIRDANGDLLDNRWEWGSIRISLNHPNNGNDAFQGNYLHGKERPGDYTHGCICNRSENVLREIRNLSPASVPRIPVEVK